ncbi:MAG: hypothetical protein ACLT3A_05965 [Subdoligranulum sp.]
MGRNWIENFRTKTLWDKRLDEETRYIVLLYKTDKFEGIVTSSEEGDVFWLTLDEMKQRKLAYGMDKMLEVFLNDNISEYFFFEENGKWIEELK